MAKIKDYIRGDTRVINLACLKSDGTALDLTGATVRFTLSATQAPTDDLSAILQKSVFTHTSPAAGLTQITINPADTQNLTPGSYFYDVQVKDASGNITSIKQDTFIINPDITRTNS